MEVKPADEDLSSPPSEISSPPSSPPQNGLDSITVAQRRPGEGVVNSAAASSAQPSAAQHAAAHHTDNGLLTTINNPPKQKRQRKPKEPKDVKATDAPKEKKPRKPREPKVKKEGEAAAAAPRKRQKTEEKTTPAPAEAPAGPRQSTILEMVNQQPQPTQPSYQQSSIPASSRPPQMPPSDSLLRSTLAPHAATPPPPRPYSSGQSYDPIRGLIIDAAPPPRPPAATPTNGHLSAQTSPHRASASPAVNSLIDPPQAPKISVQSQTSYSAHSTPQPQHQQSHPPTYGHTQTSVTPPVALPFQPEPTNRVSDSMDSAMDVDGPDCDATANKPVPEIKEPSKASSSAAPTPKPATTKANSPPRGTGSGLLSSSDLFGGPSSSSESDRKGVNIEIRIPLNPNGGNVINMAQEIAKKYGRDAVNPRAAAHRRQLLQVAAAANRLDGGSADDTSVDLLSEGEGDSNVEMGGLDDEKSATGADEKPKKRRRRKEEEYDKEDDFIDDTELAWQEQAAVAKDGFFVYSGPLVPEGQNAQVESATTTRGRGGGRGRGRGRAAATAANGTSHAAVAEKKETGTGRGRGRGRGTGAPRKPRITKADRERMEAEKQERERAASTANAAPPPTTTGQMLTTTASTSYVPPPQNNYNTQATAQSGVPA